MRYNIGTINALVRITIGFGMLAWAISKMVWRPRKESYLFIAFAAGMKIAEGILHYCPMTDVIKRMVNNNDEYDDDFYEDDYLDDFYPEDHSSNNNESTNQQQENTFDI